MLLPSLTIGSLWGDFLKSKTVFVLSLLCCWTSVRAGINRWDPKPIETGVVSLIVVDPTSAIGGAGSGPRSSTLYCTVQDVVYKATDGGDSWTRLGSVQNSYDINALVLDSQNPDTLYAGISAGAFKSRNGGMTWSPSGLQGIGVRDIAVDPSNSSKLYAATGTSYYRSLDGGESWSEIVAGIDVEPLRPYSITIDPQVPSTLYATARYSVFKSTDSGLNWSELGADVNFEFYTPTVVVDPQNSSNVYVVSRVGIYRSADGGATWNLILDQTLSSYFPRLQVPLLIDPNDSMVLYTGFGHGVLRSTDQGANWFPMEMGLGVNRVRALALDPQEPATLFAGTEDAIFRSLDGAASWERKGDGIFAAQLNDLVFNREALVAATPAGIFRSSDLGDTWNRSETALPAVYRMASDPVEPDILYAASRDSVYKSLDGGQSWQISHQNPLMDSPQALFVDSERRLYFAGSGAWRSDDQGATFRLLGVFGGSAFAYGIAVDPHDPTRLFAATDGGFFRSDDSGASWVNKSNGLPGILLLSLAVHPDDPDTLYLAGSSGIYKSVDAGEGWTRIYLPETSGFFWDVQLDPLNPAVVYAAGFGVHRSPDAGSNWRLVESGLDNDFVQSLLIDPSRPSRIYAGTDSNGVFSISLFTLDSVEPAVAGPGDQLIIRGSGFLSGPVEVLIGGVAVPVLEILDDGTLIVQVPPIGPGPADVTLRIALEDGEEVLATREGDELTVDYNQRLLLPQYGFGGGLDSQIVINNPSPYEEAYVRLDFFDPDGQPSEGVTTNQGLELMIPPLGSHTLGVGYGGILAGPIQGGDLPTFFSRSSSLGTEVVSGSVEVLSTRPVSAVIRFGLEGTGLAGVQSAVPVSSALLPVRRIRGLDTGIAARNAEDSPNLLLLELKDADGEVIAETERNLEPAGRLSEFVTQLFPGMVDPGFRGSVCIRSESGLFAAIALELEVGVAMTTLPITPIESDFSLPSAENRSIPGFTDILRADLRIDGQSADLTLWMRGPIPPEGDPRVDSLVYRISVDLDEPFFTGGEDVDKTFVVAGDSMNEFTGQGVADFEVGERSVRFRVPLSAFEGTSRFQLSADTLFLGDMVSGDSLSPITVFLPYRP